MMNDYDKTHISIIIAGHGTWFTAELIRLIYKADPRHRAKLRLGFPDEVAAVERWERGPYNDRATNFA